MKRWKKGKVKLGLDELRNELQGKTIALTVNHTAIDEDGRNLMDVVPTEWNCTVKFLIGMEHGIRGNLYSDIRSHTDSITGLKVKSLYDYPQLRPTREMLDGLDAVVFCAQDAGVRHYTYLPWLIYHVDACASAGIALYVLDRPNPLTGNIVEGRGVEKDKYSIVGAFDYPLRHGMTVGELAVMYNAVHQVGCDLRVMRMEGWKRSMWYDETGLLWLPPSPNIPTPMSFLAFAATGLMQSTNISYGVGTTTPFMVFGAPWTNGRKIADAINTLELPGLYMTDRFFLPSFDRENREVCHGAVINFDDRDSFRAYDAQVQFLCHIAQQYGEHLSFHESSYDRRVGSSDLRELLLRKGSPEELLPVWHKNAEAFESARKPYLLY